MADARRGDLLVGAGAAFATGGRFPLAGWEGDLWSLGRLELAYGLGDRVVLTIRGDVRQVLDVSATFDEPAVPLAASAMDGETADAGDFELGVSFLPLGGPRGLSLGGHVAVKLPNSDETLGIGPNTTDVTIAALGSWGADAWRATGYAGVGILESPLRSFVQNDVVVYAAEWLFTPGGRWRLAVAARGRASTRGRIPLGTEDLGEVAVTGEWRAPWGAVDLGLARGYAGNSPTWSVRAGVAWSLAGGSRRRAS